MKKIIEKLLLCASTLVSLHCGIFEDTQTSGTMDETETVIAGVLYEEGAPVPGAIVEIHAATQPQVLAKTLRSSSQTSAELSYRATTDAHGAFRIVGAVPGSYYLHSQVADRSGILVHLQLDSTWKQDVLAAQPLGSLTLKTPKGEFLSDDSLWIAQLDRTLPLPKGNLDSTLRLPPGSYSCYLKRYGKLIRNLYIREIPVLSHTLSLMQGDSLVQTPLAELKDTLDTMTVAPIDTFTVQVRPSPDSMMDSQINFAFYSSDSTISSQHSSLNQGAGICMTPAVYDQSTAMRVLMRFPLPDTLNAETLDSAFLEVSVLQWAEKLTRTAPQWAIHKILKEWKEGNETTPGCTESATSPNSATVDGVTAEERYYGARWNRIGLGLDDIDASSSAYATATFANGYLGTVRIDITSLVREWLEKPEANYGLLIRNKNEADGTYPDIPLLVSSDYSSHPTQWPALTLRMRR